MNRPRGISLSHHHSPRQYVKCFFPLLLLTITIIPRADAQDWFYTVRPGDNLWTISQDFLINMGYWRPLGRLNGLPDHNQVAPGTRLRIPVDWLKVRPVAAEALAVTGTVHVVSQDGRQRTVQTGMRLDSGDRLSTGNQSSLTVGFADGSTLLLQENASLVLDSLSAYGDTGMVDTRLRLQRGRADHQVFPRPGGASYQIDTPTASAAVRGTRFRTASDSDGNTRAEVLDGLLLLSSGAQGVTLSPRQGSLVRPGEAPIPAVTLLPAPDPGLIPPVLEQSPIPLQLPPLDGAVAYRLQIAPDGDFQTLLYDAVVNSPQLRGPELADGEYWVRLRGIDAQGLEGLDTQLAVRVNARPMPPALLDPQADAMVLEARPRFAWAAISGAQGYSFRLSTAAEPDTALVRRDNLSATQLQLEVDLPPGDYLWQVAALDQDGLGPFSDPQPFRRPRPNPGVQAPELDEHQLSLRWSAGLPGERYRLQLTRDWTFREMLEERVLDEPEITLPRPPSGIYYLRIQVIDPDGRAAPPGPKQKIVVPAATRLPLLLIPLMLLPFL